MDPLSSAVLTIGEISDMVDEMFKAESDFLVGFK